jgi:hypothetical protein
MMKARSSLSARKSPARSAQRSVKAISTTGARKFFTVKEDAIILNHIARNPEMKTSAISKAMGEKLGRGTESIRDRIKRYLSKISKDDSKKIIAASKVFFLSELLRKPLATLFTL